MQSMCRQSKLPLIRRSSIEEWSGSTVRHARCVNYECICFVIDSHVFWGQYYIYMNRVLFADEFVTGLMSAFDIIISKHAPR